MLWSKQSRLIPKSLCIHEQVHIRRSGQFLTQETRENQEWLSTLQALVSLDSQYLQQLLYPPVLPLLPVVSFHLSEIEESGRSLSYCGVHSETPLHHLRDDILPSQMCHLEWAMIG